MGFFDKKSSGLFGGGITDGGFTGGIINNRLGDIFDKGPSTFEKIEMLFTDVEIEGKKRGYDRASKEYSAVYRNIENEYIATKELIENQKNTFGKQAHQFIDRLEALEKQKEYLEKQVDSRVNEVSRKYNIPTGTIRSSMATGSLFTDNSYSIDILGIIYSYKEKKLRKAEQSGYEEAKELYESKIRKLKEELNRLKEKGDGEIKTIIEQISKILDAIAKTEMQIAELKILLQ